MPKSMIREVMTTYAIGERQKVSSSRESFDFLLNKWQDIEEYESFHAIALSRANTVIAHKVIATGGVSGCVADPKLIFRFAIQHLASGLIAAHNHPSGNMTPSQSDIYLTRKLKEGGRFLEIKLLDHLILCPQRTYYSFADEGML